MYKNKVKEKRKGLPPSRYTIVVAAFAVVVFIVVAFLLRGPFIERMTVTPTVVSRLVSPGPAVTTTMMDGVTTVPAFTATPLPIVAAATGTPTPFGIPVTLVAGTDLRVGPGEATEVVERVNAGDTILLIGANQAYTWFLVGYRSRASWVNAAALGLAINSLRQLPVVIQEDVGMAGPTLTPFPTDAPTLTKLAAITSTPAVAIASTDIPIYSGPGYEFRVITTLPRETFYQLVGVTENREWYLVSYFADQARSTRLQAWMPANVVDSLLSGHLSFVPVINLTQAPLMVTAPPITGTLPPRPTFTLTPTRTRTATPLPTFTRTRTVTQTPT